MKNYKISIDFSVENDVAALTRAAELANLIDGVVALVGPDKMIRVDETGMIVAVVRTQRPQDESADNTSNDSTQGEQDAEKTSSDVSSKK